MGFHVTLGHELYIFHDDNLTPNTIEDLEHWITTYSSKNFFGWCVKFYGDCIEIDLEQNTRGAVTDYIETLILFLNECAKYSLYLQDSVSYDMTWGDSESGVVYINSEELIVKIMGITNFGDIVNYDIKWTQTSNTLHSIGDISNEENSIIIT